MTKVSVTGKKIVNRPGIAYEGSDLDPPPPHPVEWIAETNDKMKKTTVISQTWFKARELAMIKLSVGPNQLTVRMKEENTVEEEKKKTKK